MLVGNLVIKKIISNQEPTISVKDLKELADQGHCGAK